MKLLPNYNSAKISDSKLRDYCLNPNHKLGKHKATVFKSVAGITQKDFKSLKQLILESIGRHEAIKTYEDRFGVRYQVDISLDNISSHILSTAWIVRFQEDIPELLTCYLISTNA